MAQESEFTNIGYGKVKPQLGYGQAQITPNDLAAGDFRGKQLAAQDSARKQKREDAFAKQLADYDLSNPITNPYYREIYQRELDATNKLINGLRYDQPMSVRKAAMAFNNLESLQKELNSSKWDAGMEETDPNMIYSDELNLYRSGKTEDLKQLSIEELKRKGTFGGYHEGRIDLADASNMAAELSEKALATVPEDIAFDSDGNFDIAAIKRYLGDETIQSIQNSVLGSYGGIGERQYNKNNELLLEEDINPYIISESSINKVFKKSQGRQPSQSQLDKEDGAIKLKETVAGIQAGDDVAAQELMGQRFQGGEIVGYNYNSDGNLIVEVADKVFDRDAGQYKLVPRDEVVVDLTTKEGGYNQLSKILMKGYGTNRASLDRVGSPEKREGINIDQEKLTSDVDKIVSGDIASIKEVLGNAAEFNERFSGGVTSVTIDGEILDLPIEGDTKEEKDIKYAKIKEKLYRSGGYKKTSGASTNTSSGKTPTMGDAQNLPD